MGRFDGKLALVTGATRGLGECVARHLHREGATVILSGRDSACGLQLLAELPGCEFLRLDVSDEQQWTELAARLADRAVALDVLVNNAAIVRYESIANCSSASFREVMDVNLMGVFFAIRELSPLMPEGGSIVNISSCAGLQGINGACSYVASKWAMTGLTQAAALELGRRGIRVNSVHPRAMETGMIAATLSAASADGMFDRQALPRIGTQDEVARMVAFLASAESSYCTGGAYPVDGGYMAGEWVPAMDLPRAL